MYTVPRERQAGEWSGVGLGTGSRIRSQLCPFLTTAHVFPSQSWGPELKVPTDTHRAPTRLPRLQGHRAVSRLRGARHIAST